MAIAAPGKISAQRVTPAFRRQRLAINQPFKHGLELRHVPAALLSALDILLELVGAAKRSHKPRSAKSSFLLPNRFTFLPALLACSVRAVRALGIRTSKGKPRCNLICQSLGAVQLRAQSLNRRLLLTPLAALHAAN